MRLTRPSHSTVVAYLALLIALGTGVSFAATKIKSSKQIKAGVVNGSDIKDASLDGRDVRDGGLTGADLAEGSVGGREIGDSEITADDVLESGLSGVELQNNSVKGADVDEASLVLTVGQSYQAFLPASKGIDNGGPFSFPVSPQGDLVSLNLPAGRYLILAHAAIFADEDGGSVFCVLNAAGQLVDTGNDITSADYSSLPSGVSGISVSTIATSETGFTARLSCADDGSGAEANDRGIEAVRLGD